MTYLDFINLFNRYDRELRFSDGASRMYIKLLDVANEVNRSRSKGAPWVIDFQRSDGYMAAVCGWSINTVKKHRDELEKRGLVTGDFGQAGRNSSGKYRLCHPEINVSNVDTIDSVNLSNVDTLPEINISNVDTFKSPNLSTSDTFSPENPLNVSVNVSNVDTLYIEEEKKESSAAVAAPTSASSSSKPAPRKPKAKGATHEEIAGLPLPFDGAEFAGIWQSFYTTNTKQSGKALTAFQLMLKKLGAYPEAFAVVMLERAIMGDWQGVENGGTARALAEWQTEQARQPKPAPVLMDAGPAEAPEMNPEFLAQQEQAAAARRASRLAELSVPA